MGVWALFIIINNTRYCTVLSLTAVYLLLILLYKIEMYPVIFNNRLSFSLDTHSEEILDTVISTRVILYG